METIDTGSFWSKWDLHVHTPYSFVHHYHSQGDQWEDFITDLESLPSDYKVIGVNDYLSVTGYKEIQKAKQKGRLTNIQLFLPVIELRLNKFGGSDSKLSKVNLHVIFSDKLSAETIQNGFLNSLTSKFYLLPDYEGSVDKSFFGSVCEKDISELGRKIKASVPENELKNFGTDYEVGFNNFTVNFADIVDILNRDTFKGKYLLAVGKTEWADIKWKDGAIADKKSVVNCCHFVFTSSNNPEQCVNGRKILISNKVNDCLLDCSDAHSFSNSLDKDRIGNSFTWIKARPSFEGLVYVSGDYEDRVYIGDEPPKLQLVKNNKGKFVKSISFTKIDDPSFQESWFDNVSLEFSNDLVAIIGNKGSGKSALADSLALLGNSTNLDHASFLTKGKFLNPRLNKGKSFTGTLTWLSGESSSKLLSDSVDEMTSERIKYIPQGYFEEICNEVPGGDETKFDEELKNVIFSHIDESDRLGKKSLDSLLNYISGEIKKSRGQITQKIHQKNAEIIQIEHRLSNEVIAREDARMNEIERSIHELRQNEPQVLEDSSSQNDTLIILNGQIEDLNNTLSLTKTEISNLKQQSEQANQLMLKINNLENEINYQIAQARIIAAELGITFANILEYKIDYSPLEKYLAFTKHEIEKRSLVLDENSPNSLAYALKTAIENRNSLRAGLDQTQREQQTFIERHKAWNEDLDKLTGSADTPDTLEYYRNITTERKILPKRLDSYKKERAILVNQVIDNLFSEAEVYKQYYQPVQNNLEKFIEDKTKFTMSFSVNLVNTNFLSEFLGYLNQNRTGSFQGRENGEAVVKELLEKFDFNRKESILTFLDQLIDLLTCCDRDGKKTHVEIINQLRNKSSELDFYDFIYSLNYLQPRYLLKFDGKNLNELSPGERGIVLLIFYLLIDKDTKPLIIDQPEENLDNQTIYKMLVVAIKEGKKRRQVFIVTHNPNLAVVCNAEQVISCEIDRENNNQVTYYSGPIEDVRIREAIVNILEGTRPAFNYRRKQYEPSEISNRY